MDPVLNRRISSIFLNELENFKKAMELLPQSENEEHFQFILHKIRPSMVIFEMESLIRHSELILEKKENGGCILQQRRGLENRNCSHRRGIGPAQNISAIPVIIHSGIMVAVKFIVGFNPVVDMQFAVNIIDMLAHGFH